MAPVDNLIEFMERALSTNLTLDERRRLESTIGPEADVLLKKAFGQEVMVLFSGKRRSGEKQLAPVKAKNPKVKLKKKG